MSQESVNVVFIGDEGVGKTNITKRLERDRYEFTEHTESTVGANLISTQLNTDEQSVRAQIWDPAGRDHYRTLTPIYLRQAKIIVLTYDVTNQASFESLQTWYDDFVKVLPKNNRQLIVIGNKTDLEDQRTVSPEKANAFAQSINATLFEMSAKTTERDELVTVLSNAVRRLELPSPQPEQAEPVDDPLKPIKEYHTILKALELNPSAFNDNFKAEQKSRELDELLGHHNDKAPNKDQIEKILKDKDHNLLQNRSRLTSVFFRVKSTVLGHKNPLLDNRACQSETEWRLVQAYKGLDN